MSTRPRSAFLRLLEYARPYLTWVLLAMLFAAVFAGARSLRFYLLKPLFDDVALPAMGASAPSGSALPFPVEFPNPFGSEAQDAEAGSTVAADPADPPAADAASPPDAEVVSEKIAERFWQVMGLGLLLVLVLPVAGFGKDWLVEYALGRTIMDVQRALAAKLLALPLRFHHGTARGDTLSRLLNDVQYSQSGLRLLFSDVVQAGLSLIVGFAILASISWQLTLIALLVAPPALGVIAGFGRRVRRSALLRQEKLGDLTQRMVGILSGIKVIKAFRAEANEEEAFARENRKLFRRNMRVVTNRVLSRSLVEGMNNAVGVGMLILGAALVLRGQWGLSLGDLAAFIGVMFSTYRHPKALAKGWNQLMDALPATERFFELLDQPVDVLDAPDAVTLGPLERGIRFENLSFSYGREPVLQGLDLELRAGEVTAIVGRTGAGKTTLADLLLRFYDPDAGRITLDGVDLREVRRDSLLERVAVVTQSPFLFPGSIRDNICFGRPDASVEAVRAAATAAHVDEFVDELPNGYDTEVGEEGVQLSGGQRQRITIARALLKNPDILIFDEATSSLDAKSERFVQKAVDALLGGRTVLLIAHRLSTVRHAHRIAVLDEGRVVEVGSHDELMARPGLYRELVGLQDELP